MKILTMCSSFKRPHRAKEMIASWCAKTMSPDATLVVYVSETDPRRSEYEQIVIQDSRAHVMYGPKRTMVGVLNHLSTELFPDYDYYSEANDDHIYITPGWDVILAEGIDKKNRGISVSYGQTKRFPTAGMHGAPLVKALGYFFPPPFAHMCLDLWLMDIGEATDLFSYCPEALIEHRHHDFDASLRDTVYQDGGDETFYGRAVYDNWKAKYATRDIAFLRNEISKRCAK